MLARVAPALQSAALYLQKRVDALRTDIDKHSKPKAKKGQAQAPAGKVCSPCSVLSLFVAITRALLPVKSSLAIALPVELDFRTPLSDSGAIVNSRYMQLCERDATQTDTDIIDCLSNGAASICCVNHMAKARFFFGVSALSCLLHCHCFGLWQQSCQTRRNYTHTVLHL